MKPSPKREAPKPVSWVEYSHEEPLERNLMINILGQIGSGKTTFAASASEFFPKTLPTERVSAGSKPKYVLEDMAWLSADAKATAGLRERGISVPQFDVLRYMAEKKPRPTVFEALTVGVNELLSRGPKWLVNDTVSAIDLAFVDFFLKEVGDDPFALYREVLRAHTQFYNECKASGCGILFLFHTKAENEVEVKDKKTKVAAAKQEVLQTATGGIIVPAVTGQAKRIYKGNCSMQLAVLTKEVPKGMKKVLERFVSPIKTEEHETKNRFELSLEDKEEAHLGKILEKIKR